MSRSPGIPSSFALLVSLGVLGCGEASSPSAEAAGGAATRLQPVTAEEVERAAPPSAALAPANTPAAPSAPSAAPEGSAAAAEPQAVALEPAPSNAEVIQLDGSTVALVNRAIELYQEFVTIVAKHPRDCVALEKDLAVLVAKYKSDILTVQKLQTTLEPKQLKAAQNLMTAGLPPTFIADLLATQKRCASTPGFSETLGNLQGRAEP